MSPADEDELRRLLRSVEPLETSDVAAVAIQRAGRRRRHRGVVGPHHRQDNNCSVRADDEMVGQCGAFASADALARRLARR